MFNNANQKKKKKQQQRGKIKRLPLEFKQLC